MTPEAAVATVTKVNPMIPRPMLIRRIAWETDDVYTLYMEPADGEGKEFRFLPGQFNMLYSYGVGESAISISSDPRKSSTISHTIHRVGTVTNALSLLKKGDVLGIRGPFGKSWPVEKATGLDVCIVAGGIGLAPLRPVLYSLFHRRKDFGRITLLYGARSPRDLLFRVELEQWSKIYNVNVQVTVDRGDSTWRGHIGVVTNLFNYVELDAPATIAMVCGPEIMMLYTLKEIQRRSVPLKHVYVSMERNMKCAVGYCGHCQYGPQFICKDGPVFPFTHIKHLFEMKEI